MMKVEGGGGDTGTNRWARVCDTCRSAPCTVYCRADSAYLCSTCDTRIHSANQLASRHERVYVCEACERAPAAYVCKADAASLCATCDAEIHSANPLARRHVRVPIMPVDSYGPPNDVVAEEDDEEEETEEDIEAASWLLLNNPNQTGKIKSNYCSNTHNKNDDDEDEEADEYLDVFEYYSGLETQLSLSEQFNSEDNNNSYATDSVVPCADHKHQQQYQNFLFGMEMEFETKPTSSYTSSAAHHVPVSSMDVGIVPDTTISDLSLSNPRAPKGTIDLFSGPPMQMPIQLSPLDREARVMRYREKKKNRKFEKTIRYASRKAYAETRPRIKGRFAKRTDVEAEIDDMFPNSFLADTGYGVVPSF